MITVINGDARHLPLADESVRLVCCSPQPVINVTHNAGGMVETDMTPIINGNADHAEEYFKGTLFTKKKLYDEYVVKQMTQVEIGLKHGVSRCFISTRMKKWGITSRSSINRKDLKGLFFGRWKVIKETGGRSKNGFILWKCRCQCGTKRIIPSGRLINNQTKSCGCLARELSTKHGKSKTAIHRIHYHMIDRCRNPNDSAYRYYGERGISVCDRWLGENGLINFIEDMGERPKGKSIDRINNNGNYEPQNCRWATTKEQNSNTRRNRFLTLNGEKKWVREWAQILEIKPSVILKRKRRGWSDEEALTIPWGQFRRTGTTL